jgi:hypothetical protein
MKKQENEFKRVRKAEEIKKLWFIEIKKLLEKQDEE